MRLWTYRSIAHGATGINYFRWRTARWGHEEYWHGVLPHSGRPTAATTSLKQTGEELANISPLIDATAPSAQAAIVMSYESRWALKCRLQHPGAFTHLSPTMSMEVHEEGKALPHRADGLEHHCTDALDPREDLSKYRLVIAPRLYVMDQKIAENLRSFVENGGVLCLTPRSGVADEYNVIFDQPAPGALCQAAGIEVDDYTTLEEPVTILADAGGPAGVTTGQTWADEIILTTGKAVARYTSGWVSGLPAITVNDYGKGKLVYVGTLLRGANLDAFMAWLKDLAGVQVNLVTPAGVRAYERQSQTHRLLFLLNFSEETYNVPLGATWQNILNGQAVEETILEPAGVAILQKEK
jgi:beta-galactosidase